jgi:hypothetical protein
MFDRFGTFLCSAWRLDTAWHSAAELNCYSVSPCAQVALSAVDSPACRLALHVTRRSAGMAGWGGEVDMHASVPWRQAGWHVAGREL